MCWPTYSLSPRPGISLQPIIGRTREAAPPKPEKTVKARNESRDGASLAKKMSTIWSQIWSCRLSTDLTVSVIWSPVRCIH